MRRVFSRQDDVIERWIDQSQDSARTSDYRIHFEGDNIYSGYVNSKYHHSITEKTLGKRINDNLFLISRYRRRTDSQKIYGLTYALTQENKKFYMIKSFTDYNVNVEDYKKVIKKRQKSVMMSTANLEFRLENLKKTIKEYNDYIDEFNLRIKKIDENFLDDQVQVRRVSLKLRGKL